MSAILREDPPDLSSASQHVPSALARIIAHCLEKRPEDRFRSANDLAFALEALSGSGATAASVMAIGPRSSSRRSAAVAAALVATALAGGVVIGRLMSSRAPASSSGTTAVTFQRLTFRRGNNTGARFAPDGRTIVYGAAWDGRPAELFLTRPEATESGTLGLQNADLLAMSSTSELAVKLKTRFLGIPGAPGTLARRPLTGGAPRAVSEDVLAADWSPDGKDLAAIRQVDGRLRLEYPLGHVLRELPGAFTLGVVLAVRVSPRGDLLAVLESNGGTDALVVVDRGGAARELIRERTTTGGFTLAWTPDGREIWYTSSSSKGLMAVSANGGVSRSVGPGLDWFLHDISNDGRVLVEQFLYRMGVEYVTASANRELSFLDGSTPVDLSSDGRTLLFGEAGQGGGDSGSVYVRGTDGSAPVRLGDGTPQALSPDGKWALAVIPAPPPGRLVLLPTGAGASRVIQAPPLTYLSAAWFPDGKRVLVFGSEPGQKIRGYIQDLDSGTRRAVTKDGVTGVGVVSPDGTAFVTGGPDGRLVVYGADDGEPRQVPGSAPGEIPVQWGSDGFVYVWLPGDASATVTRIDVKTGARSLWKTLLAQDSAGLLSYRSLVIARDTRSYVYSFFRALTSDLYLVEGWK
jgi:Tol biopolymer transport system component